MRNAFVQTLVSLAKADKRIVLLTGDLGYTVLEPFMEQFPDRFFNVGVAEQNMIGLATGLAKEGYIPFAYSIATFAALRPYEFIRNGPSLHALPVRIVGVGGGFDYGPAGHTHYALEDLGALRLLPGVTLISPCDHEQARAAMMETWNLPGPVYYRLGKDDKSTVPGLGGRFELGRANLLRQGSPIALVALGAMALNASLAAEQLHKEGIACTVMAVSSLQPAPVQDIVEGLSGTTCAITLESHYIHGALGSLVCEIVAEARLNTRVVRRGVTRIPKDGVGSADYLLDKNGLSVSAILTAVKECLAAEKSGHASPVFGTLR